MSITLETLRALPRAAEQLQEVTAELRTGRLDQAQALQWAQQLGWPDSVVSGLRRFLGGRGYAEDSQVTTRGTPLPTSSPLFVATTPVQTARALQIEVDQHLATIEAALPAGDAAVREALRALGDRLTAAGADAIDAIGGGAGNSGFGYVNSRLRRLGLDAIAQPAMDVETRALLRTADRGVLKGAGGTMSILYTEFSESTQRLLREAGFPQAGKWSVRLEGQEEYGHRVDARGSVHCQHGRFSETVESDELEDALRRLIDKQLAKAPSKYVLTVDLRKVDPTYHAKARSILAELGERGVALRFYQTDLAKEMAAHEISIELDRRMRAFTDKAGDPAQWTPEQDEEWMNLLREYHNKPNPLFEEPHK